MASAPIGGPPGTAGAGSGFPQWGFDQAGKIVKAANQSQKIADMNAGYLEWFTSRQAAASAWQGQQGPLGTGGGSISNPLASLGKFFGALGQASTWTRVAEVLIGAALIIVGLARLGGNSQIVRTAGKVAATTGLAA